MDGESLENMKQLNTQEVVSPLINDEQFLTQVHHTNLGFNADKLHLKASHNLLKMPL